MSHKFAVPVSWQVGGPARVVYLCLFLFVKRWRKVDLFLPYLQEHLVSLHRRGSRRVAHLKEDDPNTVDVNFLK